MQKKDWLIPKNIADVRAFLGLCSYYRCTTPGFSTCSSPLNDLLRAGQTFKWTQKCQDAFEDMNAVLTGEEVMAYPKDDGLYILDTDASLTGIGAALSQMQWSEQTEKYVERPVAFASKSLAKTQRRY